MNSIRFDIERAIVATEVLSRICEEHPIVRSAAPFIETIRDIINQIKETNSWDADARK